ncbi:hypothetical protein NXW21_21475 [Parabacteroides distasonis]|nr:hypothetical protein [Parabacteroides distasonis]
MKKESISKLNMTFATTIPLSNQRGIFPALTRTSSIPIPLSQLQKEVRAINAKNR